MSLISVVIPVYNARKYLNKCLESVVNQCFEDFEVVVVNDGSTDGSDAICDEWSKKDSRIKVIHQENKGVAATRNIALAVASAPYIAFVDSDDYIERSMLSTMYQEMLRTHADIVIVNHCRVYANGKTEVELQRKEKFVLEKKEALKRILADYSIKNYLWDKLFKKSLFDQLFFKEGAVFEDIHILYQVFSRSKKTAVLPDVMYYYRQRADSIMGSFHPSKEIDYCKNQQAIYTFIQSTDLLTPSEKRYLVYFPIKNMMGSMYKVWKKERHSIYWQEMEPFLVFIRTVYCRFYSPIFYPLHKLWLSLLTKRHKK